MWLGDGFGHWSHGRQDHVRGVIAEGIAGGCNALDSFMELDGWFWGHGDAPPGRVHSDVDLSCGPVKTPDYYGQYEAYVRYVTDQGLKFGHIMGDMGNELASQSARLEHARQIGAIHTRIGREKIAWMRINEPQGIGETDPTKLRQFSDTYREATGGEILTFCCALQSESPTDIARYAAGNSGWDEHTLRRGTFEQQVHHVFSLLREGKIHERIAWNGLFSEGVGPQDPVSVQQQNDPPKVIACRLMEVLCHSPMFLFCGKGLFSHWHGPFADVPGWSDAIWLAQWLEDHVPALHTLPVISHYGSSANADPRPWDVANPPANYRFDQFGDPGSGVSVSLSYCSTPVQGVEIIPKYGDRPQLLINLDEPRTILPFTGRGTVTHGSAALVVTGVDG